MVKFTDKFPASRVKSFGNDQYLSSISFLPKLDEPLLHL